MDSIFELYIAHQFGPRTRLRLDLRKIDALRVQSLKDTRYADALIFLDRGFPNNLLRTSAAMVHGNEPPLRIEHRSAGGSVPRIREVLHHLIVKKADLITNKAHAL